MRWQKTWESIPQLFSHPFNILCLALALPYITHFSAGFESIPGHLILSAWSR